MLQKLPQDERYETTMFGRKKKVVTEGDKWMVFQLKHLWNKLSTYYVLDNQENSH